MPSMARLMPATARPTPRWPAVLIRARAATPRMIAGNSVTGSTGNSSVARPKNSDAMASWLTGLLRSAACAASAAAGGPDAAGTAGSPDPGNGDPGNRVPSGPTGRSAVSAASCS